MRYVDEDSRAVLRTFSEFYKYDDAGNRIKKVIRKYVGTDPEPDITSDEEESIYWTYELIQHYVRDLTGNELAVYNDTTVTFWNVYGIDNAGKINYSDNSWNYYLKDHLGSPRVVIDQNGDIISAEDLDMWGYRMADRSFQSDTTFYKYTGKERDVTTGYDYFGARYYDSRIGRWGQVEPLLEKYTSWSPYNYGLNNPIILKDVDGLDVIVGFAGWDYPSWIPFYNRQVDPSDFASYKDSYGTFDFLDQVNTFITENNIDDVDIAGFWSHNYGFDVSDAFDFIMSNLDNEGEKVIIYGYSQGGHNAVELANKLNSHGVNVDLLITVDAFNLGFSTNRTIPGNVLMNVNYYQEKDLIKGGVNRASKTENERRVKNYHLKNSSHTRIDEQTAHRSAKKVKELYE